MSHSDRCDDAGSAAGPSALFGAFASLPDPRSPGYALRHEFYAMLAIALCAMICGAETFVDIARFGAAKERWLREGLGLSLPNGIPSHDTFGRVFAMLDPDAFGACFAAWTRQLHQMSAGGVIACDGKVLRHSFDKATGLGALQMVSAWSVDARLVLAQVAVAPGSNEITAMPLLLRLLDLTGCVVTMDAFNTQKEIAAQITEQGGHYLLPLKQNHPLLHDEVSRLFDWAASPDAHDITIDYAELRDYDHGRQEIRRCWCTGDLHWLDETDEPAQWADLCSVIRIERQRTLNGQTSVEQVYFLSSCPPEARRINGFARAHWGVENSLHWVLDASFDEDSSRIRKDHAPQNLAILRHLALNLLRQETTDKAGIKARRLRAAWDDQYLWKVLTANKDNIKRTQP